MSLDNHHTSEPIFQPEIPDTHESLADFDASIQLKKLKNEIIVEKIEKENATKELIKSIISEFGVDEYAIDIKKLKSGKLKKLEYNFTTEPGNNTNLEPIKDAILVLSKKKILTKLEFEHILYKSEENFINIKISIKKSEMDNAPCITSISLDDGTMNSTLEL